MSRYQVVPRDLVNQHLPVIEDSLTVIIGYLRLLAERSNDENDRKLLLELLNEGKKISVSISEVFPPTLDSNRKEVNKC